MPIVRQWRQTLIDHDPNTGTVVGATKIFTRFVEEAGVNLGNLPNENEDLAVANIPTIWGVTSDVYSAKLAENSAILQAERDATAANNAVTAGQIQDLSARLAAADVEIARLSGLVAAIQTAVNPV